jgi:pyruvate dehydrogenase E2 component (dihydrolipoamide acetyltransferase)
MVQAVRMPMMGNTMETGLVAEWVAGEGDEVEEDEVIAIVESEKAAADVVASQAGTLARIDVQEGEEVPPGTLIGVVLRPAESLEDAPEPGTRIQPGETDDEPTSGEGATTRERDGERVGTNQGDPNEIGDVPAAPGARRLAAEHDTELSAVEPSGPDGAVLIADVEEYVEASGSGPTGKQKPPISSEERVFASPSSRRLAREFGVSIDCVKGTGPGGRITESDIRKATGGSEFEHQTAGSRPTETAVLSNAEVREAERFNITITEEQDLRGMRRTIAERMSQSAQQAPHVTLKREVAVERAFQTANELSQDNTIQVGFTDVLIAAAVRALDNHPRFNAWFEGGKIRHISEQNVAVAVDTDAGLVTPVIREAGNRTLWEIAERRRELTDAVLESSHSMDELQGGTFTITNLGMFDVDSFDPIINPPQIAILGVGRVHDGDNRTCTLSLSFDHRVVDGADAARFLDTLVYGVEAPSVVVAERSGTTEKKAQGSNESGQESQSQRDGSASIDELVRQDITERAQEIADIHGWEAPSFSVQVGGTRPSVTVHEVRGTPQANLKRLTYAACRDSEFVDTIVGLRNPEITLK